MSKQIATVVLTVSVEVPDHYSDQTVASLQSRLQHFDLKGCLYDDVKYGALTAKPNEPCDYDVRVVRSDA